MKKELLKKLLLDMIGDYRHRSIEREPGKLSLKKMQEELADDWAEEIMSKFID